MTEARETLSIYAAAVVVGRKFALAPLMPAAFGSDGNVSVVSRE